MCGLPEKQLYFLFVGCDTLPTPMNLARWNIIVSPVRSLCSSRQPTTNHILTGCFAALDPGRYTWHHDSVSQVFVQGLQRDYCPIINFTLISLVTWLVLELSVVTNTKQHLLAANFRKEGRYSSLIWTLHMLAYLLN